MNRRLRLLGIRLRLLRSRLRLLRSRLRRRSQLQRDWESGDPERVQRVRDLAERINRELDQR